MADLPAIGSRPFGGIKNLLRPLAIPLSGLTAYRQRMETIANNMANMDTMMGPNGEPTPYRRQVAILEQQLDGGVRVAGIQDDNSEFITEYDPGHPMADELGYVRRPNVDIHVEVTDMMISRRMFEANATVFDAAKAMLRRALDI